MASKDLVAASARPVLLSVLSRGESYGYEIIQEVRRLSGGELSYSEGMLYPVLQRMEQEGLIESFWGESAVGRRRKYYRIRDEGTTALARERSQWLGVHNTLARLWGMAPCPTA